jgi:hypothetical protein
MTDTLPVSVTYTNGTLTATSGSVGYSSGVINWSGTMNAAATVTVTFGASVSPNTPWNTTITNTAVINGGGEILTRAATVRTYPPLLYLPLINACPAGIYGHVTTSGSAASGVLLELRWYDGFSYSTISTIATLSDGSYRFAGVPSLAPGQRYYVRYMNGVDNTRLSFWGTRVLTSYTTGNCVGIGDFDLANIPLVSPANAATVSPPQTFSWTPRSATPADSYEFDLFNPSNPPTYTPAWWTSPLGYVSSYSLNSLLSGFNVGTPYGWFMAVYSPDGGYGESFYYRQITFSNAGLSPSLRMPLSPRPAGREASPPMKMR